MKFAFSTLGCPDWPIETVVAMAKSLKYDGVEIRGIKRVLDLSKAPEFASERINATKKLFADAGVKVVSIDASASFCWPEPTKREEALAEAVRHVDIAQKMGAPFVRVFGGNVPEGDTIERWARTVAENLKRLGGVAAKKGVTIILETHDSWRRASEIMPVLRMVDMDNVRLLWDLAHPWSAGDTMDESADQFTGHVAHVHIKDHTADHKEALLGRGIIPLDEAFAALKRMKYDGYVSLEWEKMWHPEIEDPEIAFPQAIEYMRHLDAET
jgi:sugar phosphate isomerase/epimerase